MTAITRVEVDLVRGRHVVRVRHALLRAQVVAVGPVRCRVGLLATTALLLGGDEVALHVRVGPGAHLELFDVAATVAYHGRGSAASWRVDVRLAEGARLAYAGEPFVVSDGADVTRTLEVDLDPQASAVLRDTVVLGRSGEDGGALRSTTTVRRGGDLVLLEDQRLVPGPLRKAPGMLGGRRIVDSLTCLGPPPPGTGPTASAVTFALLDGAGTLTRWLGDSLADSPLHAVDLATDPASDDLVATS